MQENFSRSYFCTKKIWSITKLDCLKMNSSILHVSRRYLDPARLLVRAASTSKGTKNPSASSDKKQPKRSSRASLGVLQSIVSKMQVEATPDVIGSFGTSDMFNYATNPKYDRAALNKQTLETWSRLQSHENEMTSRSIINNAIDELILLTEQGKLWHYPIDNEQGLDEEKKIPFEEHVFLDDRLEEFPNDEYIRGFMEFVFSGLAKNPWITVERKQRIINFYKDYFNEKRDLYKQSGFDMAD